jgi:trehalose-phosphatase
MKDAKHIPDKGRDGAGYLFARWPQVARRIRSASHLVLFLDFDGTLTPIRRRPEDVPPLDLPTRRLLRRLADCPWLDVYVISGRRLADLRARVRVPGVHLLGLYGWEARGVPPARKERELVQRLKRLLAARLAGIPRVWLEDKNLGIAVHYRGALPAEARAARVIVRRVLERFKPQLRLIQERRAWQLLPRAVDGKGPAVLRLLGKRRRPALPVFAGDDAADESAFVALPRGITVQVGNTRRTKARFYLRNPAEVLTFLRKLEAEVA